MNFKDAENAAKNALLAEEAKVKGWFTVHKLLWITGLVCLAVGFALGKL